MEGIIIAAINAITEGLKLANTEVSRKYIDTLYRLKIELSEEENRGQVSDDLKIQRLYREIKITWEAAEQEIRLAIAQKS